jgi:hypothetical protein
LVAVDGGDEIAGHDSSRAAGGTDQEIANAGHLRLGVELDDHADAAEFGGHLFVVKRPLVGIQVRRIRIEIFEQRPQCAIDDLVARHALQIALLDDAERLGERAVRFLREDGACERQ